MPRRSHAAAGARSRTPFTLPGHPPASPRERAARLDSRASRVPLVMRARAAAGRRGADPPIRPGLAAITARHARRRVRRPSRARAARCARAASARTRHRSRSRCDGRRADDCSSDICRSRGLELAADMVIAPQLRGARLRSRARAAPRTACMQLRDMPPALADRAFAQLLYGEPSVRAPADRHRRTRSRR